MAKHSYNSDIISFPLIGASLFGFAFAFIGLLLSQYGPVFGGFLEKTFAQPWSPARIDLIPVHILSFGFAGAMVGGSFGLLIALSTASKTN